MPTNPPTDQLIKLGVREVLTQCSYAKAAYSNIDLKAANSTDTIPLIFSSIHSFLSHCGVLSRLLTSPALAKNAQNKTIGQILGLSNDLKILDRSFRDSLEHYDERLAAWIKSRGSKLMIADNNVGPKSAIGLFRNSIVVRNYDPKTATFTLIDKDLDLEKFIDEVNAIKEVADEWVRGNPYP